MRQIVTNQKCIILHYVRNVKYMNSLEKFYIYNESMKNNQINEKSTYGTNKIFDVKVCYESEWCPSRQ